MSKKSFKLWSVLLSIFLMVSMVPTVVFAGSSDAIKIVSQPQSITAQAGEEKTLSVVAKNATSYQWQRSSDGTTWNSISATNSNYIGAKTESMTVKVSKTTAGFVYRCMVKNSSGSVPTDVVTVTLSQGVTITTQPKGISGAAGEEKSLSVTATNATSYQWQRSSDGETWTSISATNGNYTGVKTNTMTVKISKTTAGFTYRCVIKNGDSSVISEVAEVALIQPITITTQPKGISGAAGEEKSLSVTATNATSYQWQRSSDGETWTSISATNTNYTGVKTNTMTVKISKTTADFVYRCVVKNSDASVNSAVATVVMTKPIVIVEQPESIIGQIGETKSTSIEATNAKSYQWQRSSDGETWSSIGTTNTNYSGVKTATLTVKISKTTASYIYRCVVKSSSGDSLTSNLVEVAVATSYAKVTFDGNGGNIVFASGKYPLYTVEVEVNKHVDFHAYAEKDKCSFAGWYLDSACTLKVDLKEYVVTEDVTLYAKWVTSEIELPFIPIN